MMTIEQEMKLDREIEEAERELDFRATNIEAQYKEAIENAAKKLAGIDWKMIDLHEIGELRSTFDMIEREIEKANATSARLSGLYATAEENN